MDLIERLRELNFEFLRFFFGEFEAVSRDFDQSCLLKQNLPIKPSILTFLEIFCPLELLGKQITDAIPKK